MRRGRCYSEAGAKQHSQGLLFKQPKKLDPFNLIAVDTEERDGVQVMRLPKAITVRATASNSPMMAGRWPLHSIRLITAFSAIIRARIPARKA